MSGPEVIAVFVIAFICGFLTCAAMLLKEDEG